MIFQRQMTDLSIVVFGLFANQKDYPTKNQEKKYQHSGLEQVCILSRCNVLFEKFYHDLWV